MKLRMENVVDSTASFQYNIFRWCCKKYAIVYLNKIGC